MGAILVAQLVENPAAMQEVLVYSWIRKILREGKGYPLQYSGLENSMDYIVLGLQRVEELDL